MWQAAWWDGYQVISACRYILSDNSLVVSNFPYVVFFFEIYGFQSFRYFLLRNSARAIGVRPRTYSDSKLSVNNRYYLWSVSTLSFMMWRYSFVDLQLKIHWIGVNCVNSENVANMWGHALDIPLQIVKILFIFGRRLGDLVVNGKHCENSVRLYLAKIVNILYASYSCLKNWLCTPIWWK